MTASRPEPEGFIQWLYSRAKAKDRATLAALRRGLLLEPAQFFQLYAVIPPQFLDVSRAELERRLVVAILFSTHWEDRFSEEQLKARGRTLGESLRDLAVRKAPPGTSPDEILPDSLKRRLDAVLAAREEDLFGHLRHLISLLKSESVPVDWQELLWSLRRWSEPERPVQWRWSRSFYVGWRETAAETAEGGV